MRNEWSIRIQHKVPGSMLKKLAVGIPIVRWKKDVKNMWMHVVDYEEFSSQSIRIMLLHLVEATEMQMVSMNFGKSGNVIKTGAGLYEQMEVANTMYYNILLSFLRMLFMSFLLGKFDFDRYFVIKTGERRLFSSTRQLLNTVSGWTHL